MWSPVEHSAGATITGRTASLPDFQQRSFCYSVESVSHKPKSKPTGGWVTDARPRQSAYGNAGRLTTHGRVTTHRDVGGGTSQEEAKEKTQQATAEL